MTDNLLGVGLQMDSCEPNAAMMQRKAHRFKCHGLMRWGMCGRVGRVGRLGWGWHSTAAMDHQNVGPTCNGPQDKQYICSSMGPYDDRTM